MLASEVAALRAGRELLGTHLEPRSSHATSRVDRWLGEAATLRYAVSKHLYIRSAWASDLTTELISIRISSLKG